MRQEKSLSERIRALPDDRVRAESRLPDLKIRVMPPKSLLRGLDVGEFTAKMRAVLTDRETDQAKAFLRLFVSEIRVYADEATITGSNFGAVEAMVHSKRGTREAVPSFIHKWRRG